MTSIGDWTTFFGWCSVINIGILLALLLRGVLVRKLTARVFGITTEEVKVAYMNVFLQYRNATLVLSVTPYVALKIMSWSV